jgi:mono/diheme cytochrome c family protein
MSSEEMGKVSKRIRAGFALSSVVFLAVLAASPVRDYFREWKRYERSYLRFAQTRPDTRNLLADFRFGINQIWVPQLNVVDRCTTCHQGISEPSLQDVSVPQPFRAHPPIPHRVEDWGCVACHRGQGLATEVTEAHETTLAWEQPLLPIRYIQASCGSCHEDDLPETPQLNRGRELLSELNCEGCHRLRGIERPAMIGPDLTNIGTKVSREWIYKWLKEPRTILDSQGNVVVNGVENEETPRMPQFRLSEAELRDLSAYLSTLKSRAFEPYQFEARVVAAWQKRPDLAAHGELRFRQMFCTDCHTLAVVRAGTTTLIGGDIGPELTKVGSKVNPDWLVRWLRDPQSYLPHSKMPRYEWSDEDLYTVAQYIEKRLVDPDLLSDVPKLSPASQSEAQHGRLLFLEKGCAGCHLIAGIAPQQDFGPDLSALGGKSVSELYFGEAKVPHTLIAYIQAKIADPLRVNPAARMPQYHLNRADLDAITTALLGMKGTPTNPGLASLVAPSHHPSFDVAGEFGQIYERYRCYVCHRFNGYGGTLAPDLSFEGSRAQRAWLLNYLKDPQTLRPTLTVRMPQFNMTAQEANTVADYLELVMQSSQVNKAGVSSKDFTPTIAALGKQLYEVKYQCQSCHTIGSTGGYVGPALTNAGNWLNAAWIEAWLRNPQALIPDTIEPHREFTESEIQALTAYLLTLKQAPAGRGVGGFSLRPARAGSASSTTGGSK